MKNSFYKVLSILLSVALTLSVFTVAVNAQNITENKYTDNSMLSDIGEHTITQFITKEFFVINGGRGDGTSKENAAASVKDVIPAINSANLSANDTALITILEREDWNAAPDSGGFHNMTYIGGFPSQVAPKVIIQGDPESENKVHLAYNENASSESYRNTSFMDDLTFRNLVFVNTCRDSYIFINGHNINFESTVDIASAYRWQGGALNGNEIPRIALTKYTASETYSSQKVNLSGAFTKGKISIPSNNYCPVTYTGDVEIVLDNKEIGSVSAFQLSFAGYHENQVTSKFTKALNINIKNASKVNFVSGANANGKQKILVTEGIQVILNSNTEYNTTNLYDVSSIDKNSPLYTIINKSGNYDALSFTDTVGTYKIAEGLTAVATNTETKKKYISANALLTLPEAGTYTLEVEKEPVSANYYVISGGTGNGKSAEAPAGSVAQAIVTMNADGLVKGDTANIYIMQRNDWNTIPEGVIGNVDGVLTTQRHNMTSWTEEGEKAPAHTATVVIKKHSNSTTYLAYSPLLGENIGLAVAGPTVFEDITLVCMRELDREIITGNNCVTFGTDVVYACVDNDCYASSPKKWNGKVSSAWLMASIPPLNYTSANNFNNEFTTTFKGSVGSIGSFVIGARGYGNTVYNEDCNIEVDSFTSNLRLIWGGTYSQNTNVFKKNFNINVKSAPAIFNESGTSAVTVEGGIQAIYSGDTLIRGFISSLQNVTANKGVWEIINKSNNPDALSFTAEAGTFNVPDGFIATVKNTVTGEVISSVDGRLKIPAGSYELTLCELFANTGDGIYVYYDCEIDLGAINPAEKEGMLFIGWVNSKTNAPANQIDIYTAGDILKAQYIPYTEDDFKMEQTEARDGASLRYVFTQSKNLTDKLPAIVEYGALTLPTDVANGFEFYVDRGAVKTWAWDEETKLNFTPSSYTTPAIKVTALNILEESKSYLKYTLCLTNIEKSKTRVFYGARGYLTFKDLNGIEHTIYTEQRQSSLYKAAAETPLLSQNDVSRAVVAYAEGELTDDYWKSHPITRYISGVSGTALSDPQYMMYDQAGIRIAHPTINTGMDVEKYDFIFFTDPHFNHTDEADIKSRNRTLFANYRIRTWLQAGEAAIPNNNIMNYAANFKKVIVGGDAMEFFSNGCRQMVYRLLAEKSVNGSVKMVFGNHETMETGGEALDVPYFDRWTNDEKCLINQPYWSNNVFYDSEIVKKSNGENNIMFIYINNGDHFKERQIEPLTKDLTYARANNIPVFIFFHIPIATYNEADRAVYVNTAYGKSSYGTPDNYTRISNYCDDKLGSPSSDKVSIRVVNLIRSHSDVVKGVFNGHEHEWSLTHIVGIDQNGNPNGNYIPQYNIYGSHYSGACRVTVK